MADMAWQEAWVEVLPDFSNFRQKAIPGITKHLSDAGDEGGQESARRFGSSFAGGIGKAGGLILGAVAALGIANLIGAGIRRGIEFGIGTIDIASDLNESVNAVRVTYGEVADAIFGLGDASAKTFGLSKRDLNAYAVQFAGFSKTIAGSTGDVAGSFQSILTRATDFASVMNLEVSEALGLFQSGLAGETEPLRRYNVDLSAAAVEAYALANGISDGTTQLTEAQKVQARYASLLAQTSAVQGDYMNTSGELANLNRSNAAAWDNLQASIGERFLPVATNLATILASDVLPAVGDLVDKYGPQLATAFEDSLPSLKAFAEDVLPKIPELVKTLAENLPALLDATADVITFVVDMTGKFAIGAQQIEDFLAVGEGEDPWLKWRTGRQQIEEFFTVAGERFALGAEQWGSFFEAVGGWFQGFADNLARGQAQVFGFFGSIGASFALGWQQIASFFGNVQREFEAFPARIAVVFAGIGTTLFNSGRSLIQGFINGISSMVKPAGDAVAGVLNWVKGFFPNSPAKRGPLAGAGWNSLARSGEAYINQWTSGMANPVVTDALTPVLANAPLSVRPSVANSAALSGGSSAGFQNHGTLIVRDERLLIDEVDKRKRRAMAGGGY